MLLAQDEVVKRLCNVCSKVRAAMSKENSVASDCFCGQSVPDPQGFQFDSKVLKFIEDAVAERMRLDKIAKRYYG
jgi:hypothetical protein